MKPSANTSTVTVPATLIAAALLFVAKNDVRYYLDGVHIKIEGEHGFLSATDGYSGFLGRFDVDPKSTLPFEAIIPSAVLTGKAKDGDVVIQVDGTRVTVWRGDQGRISSLIDFNRFPNLREVIPLKTSGKATNIQSQFLVRAQKVMKLLDSPYTPLQHNGGAAAVAVFECAVVLIMPLRPGVALPVPAWATTVRSPATVEKEVATT